jgi:hypothetical protein
VESSSGFAFIRSSAIPADNVAVGHWPTIDKGKTKMTLKNKAKDTLAAGGVAQATEIEAHV